MKLFITLIGSIVCQTTMFETTTLPAHNPEAMAFCASACKGTENALPNGKCTDGFYTDPDECSAYYICWDQGEQHFRTCLLRAKSK